MDSPEASPAAVDKKGFRDAVIRCSFALLLYLLFVVSVSITILFLSLLFGNLSIANPISVPCQCKIVSSSVDLRSSKVCELGLLNYKATHVFYPSEKKKFRCRYDYYWASVFKVEYVDHSGHSQLAFAEAPNEALSPDCRPTFSSAWLTKDKFKVNETYNCRYTLGISKLNIDHDDFYKCQTSNPSTVEMLKRHSILVDVSYYFCPKMNDQICSCSRANSVIHIWMEFTRMLISWLTNNKRGRFLRWEVIAGVFSNFSTSYIAISLGRFLFNVMSTIQQLCANRISIHTAVCIRRGCFLIAYFSFASWLSIQYGRRLGSPEIFHAHE